MAHLNIKCDFARAHVATPWKHLKSLNLFLAFSRSSSTLLNLQFVLKVAMAYSFFIFIFINRPDFPSNLIEPKRVSTLMA